MADGWGLNFLHLSEWGRQYSCPIIYLFIFVGIRQKASGTNQNLRLGDGVLDP